MGTLTASRVILGEDFTVAEYKFLQSVLDETSTVDLIIPDSMDPQKLWDSLDACCKMARAVGEAGNKLKPVLGRILIQIRDYPDLYRERGYRNYDDFITRGLSELFGVSRSEGYAAIKITECFPSLTIEDYKDIGVAKLQVLSRETSESDSDFRELVGKAKELTVKELKDH